MSVNFKIEGKKDVHVCSVSSPNSLNNKINKAMQECLLQKSLIVNSLKTKEQTLLSCITMLEGNI